MEAQDAIELGREAIMLTLLIGSPVLMAGMVVGLLIGLAQALTQIQEQTVAFVPKLVAMVFVLALTMPWLIDQLTQYTTTLIEQIPQRLSGS
jgi:flagellar biosynthetic protein FliQ